MDNTATYPNPMIDPRQKGFEYILQYCKAAYKDGLGYMPAFLSNLSLSRYSEIKEYAQGKQSVTKYKKVMPGTEINDNTALSDDFSVLAILPKFREIAISKLMQRNYDVQAFAIDPLSRSEEDTMFNQMKIKIIMREAAKKAGSPLADSPFLQPAPGEPEDMEQLKMYADYGYKNVLCMEAEEAIQLVQEKNNKEEERKRTFENCYDFGASFYRCCLDENGQVYYRAVDMMNFMCSFCIRPDFDDMKHAGEFKEILVDDLAPYFSPAQMEYICVNVQGKYGNPASFVPTGVKWWNRFKVRVWDFQFKDWDTLVYGEELDGKGNQRFGKVDYSNIVNVDADMRGGEQLPIYSKVTKSVVRKCMWIVDTDLMYNWGLSENQYRRQSTWWDTKIDYIGYAWNFNRMIFAGITERLIPIADAIQLTWLKLQNLKKKLIPYLIELDLTALENVAIGKAGVDMSPEKLIDFAFENFIMLYRSDPLTSKANPNYKAMRIEASGQLTAFGQLYQDLEMQINMMRQISGLNEITDASTPNPKTLVPGYEAAEAATNNALYLISNAEKNLCVRLSDQIFCKIQIALKLGKIEGYVKPLGMETVKFLQINPELALREFGIFLEEAPTDTQREQLIAELNLKDSQGLIDPSDKILVMSCRNLKQARVLLAYNVKKRREEQYAQQQALVKQQGDNNTQTGIQIEAAKQKTIMLQLKGQAEIETLKGQWQYMIESMKKSSDQDEAKIQGQAKVISAQIAANAKQAANQLAI